jgi:hypothetical protein
MYVNGIRFNAFANLARALRQIARARSREELVGEPQLIWADQVCISQSSPKERSHQVGFMRKIYASAQVVIACLGSEDPSDGLWVSAANLLAIESYIDAVLKEGARSIYLRDTFLRTLMIKISNGTGCRLAIYFPAHGEVAGGFIKKFW